MRPKALLRALMQRPRIAKYKAMSSCKRLSGSPIASQPVLFLGSGHITLGRDVEFGWRTSMGFYTGYCHVEASTPQACVDIGDNAQINNNVFIKAEGPGIKIGARALIGSNVTIYDSDFHDLRAERRRGGHPRMGAVEIAEDVFIGDHAIILKGVKIGAHAVIGAGSVVTSSVPGGMIAAGNPAKVIGPIPDATKVLDKGDSARARVRARGSDACDDARGQINPAAQEVSAKAV
jgi:maltose O-acetyltransferase